jgi:MFS family permease
VTIPVVPLFAAGPVGADEVGVGIVVGAFAATALVLRPLAGRTSDRRGRRPLLIWGAFLFGAAMAAHMLTTDLFVLIGLRLLLGVAEAFFFVAGIAALADLAPPERRGEALSYNSLALYLGIAFGPTLGHLLLEVGGFQLAWIGGALLALTAGAIATRLPEMGRRAEAGDHGAPAPLIHPAALIPGLALLSALVGMGGFLAFVTLHAHDLGMDGSGVVLLIFGLTVVGCRIAFARLPDRVPPFRLIAAALGLTAIGLATAGLLSSVAGLIAGTALMAVGVAFITPATFAAIFARVEPAERGAASGTASVFIDLGLAGGPILFGFVAAAASIPVAFGVAAVIAATGALGSLMWALPRRASMPVP